MGARINVYPDNTDEFESLRDWLRTVPGVSAEPVPREIRPGEQGGVWDFLSVTSGAGGTAAVLGHALKTWIESRVTVLRVKTDDGTEIVLKSSDAGDLAPRLIELLQRPARDDDA